MAIRIRPPTMSHTEYSRIKMKQKYDSDPMSTIKTSIKYYKRIHKDNDEFMSIYNNTNISLVERRDKMKVFHLNYKIKNLSK